MKEEKPLLLLNDSELILPPRSSCYVRIRVANKIARLGSEFLGEQGSHFPSVLIPNCLVSLDENQCLSVMLVNTHVTPVTVSKHAPLLDLFPISSFSFQNSKPTDVMAAVSGEAEPSIPGTKSVELTGAPQAFFD